MKSVAESMLKQLKFKEGEDLKSLKTVSIHFLWDKKFRKS